MEKVFRTVGQDRAANEVYLERRHVERQQKWQRGQIGSWFLDGLYALLANYGVRPYQLIGIPVMLLLLAMVLFYQPGSVVTNEESKAGCPVPGTNLSLWDALGVSLHEFLPVDVPLGACWIPSQEPIEVEVDVSGVETRFQIRPSTYSTFFLRLAGWVLVPLGVGAMTGLLRRVAP